MQAPSRFPLNQPGKGSGGGREAVFLKTIDQPKGRMVRLSFRFSVGPQPLRSTPGSHLEPLRRISTTSEGNLCLAMRHNMGVSFFGEPLIKRNQKENPPFLVSWGLVL